MADLNQLKSFNNLKTITNSQGNNILISNGISSLNFDGNIPKISSLKKVSDIKIGDVVSSASFAKSNESFLITKIVSETYTISSVSTIVYFLYYLSDDDGEKQLTYGSAYTNILDAWYNSYNGLQQLYVLSDDTDNVDLGTNGWFISNAGNAVFSNGFFRGRIEATDGIFSGKVSAGDSLSQITIGKDLFNSQEFRDVDTPSIISVPALTKTHGLMIDSNNYFFTFSGETSTAITKLDVSDSIDTEYEYYAEFVYESPFVFTDENRINLNSNMTIFNLVDPSESNSNLASLNRSFFPTAYTSDTKFKVKIPFPLTQYTSTYPYTINPVSPSEFIGYAKNVTFTDDIKITSIILTREAIVTNKSLSKIYISNASSYSIGDFVTLSGFTTTSGSVDLTPLNQTFPITQVNTSGANYIILNTNRITAGNNYLTGLGRISDFGQISKFKVGNSTSFMKYDSSLNDGLGLLKVTGEINATSGTFNNVNVITGTIGGWAINTSSLTAGKMDSSGNGIQFSSGTNPYIKINNAPSLDYNDLLIQYGAISAPDFGNPKINDSRGEIIFWKNTSGNPNRITMRRFAEANIPFIATISNETPAIITPATYAKTVNFSVSSGKTITLSDTNNLSIGMKLTGTNIPSDTYITDIPSGVTIPEITISNDITSTVSSGTTLTFSYSYSDGIRVYLSTSGTLPGGLVASTSVIYYIVQSTSSTFKLSSSEGGTPINTYTSGSGVHTVNFKEADGLAYMDMTSNAIGGTPDFAEINLSVSRSDGISPSSIDSANVYISQGIADTNNTTKPATVKLNATNNNISNSLLITANNPARFYDGSNNNTFTTHPDDGSGFSNASSGTATAYLNRYYSEGTNFNTVTSSTYAAGSPACAFVFKTGVTGKISVNVGGLIRNDTLGQLVGVSYQIYEGTSSSGTLIVDTSDNRAFLNYNSAYIQGSFTSLISLTANTTYYIRTMHRVSSGNGVIATRFLTVTALN